MPAVVTTYLGFHFGMVLQYFKSHGARLQQWVPFSLGLLAAGLIVHFAAWKANKQLWSPAYVLIMAGCNGLVLTAFYLLQDATHWQPGWLKRRHQISSTVTFGLTDVLRYR